MNELKTDETSVSFTTQPDLRTLDDRFEEVRSRWHRLVSVGLAAEDETDLEMYSGTKTISPELVRLIEIILEGHLQKTGVSINFAERLHRFLREINGHFSEKTVKITRDNGIEIDDESERQIAPSCLSSGEKNLFILLYILFVEDNSDKLILIDEPEISLNLYWKQNFPILLNEVSNYEHCQFLVATHSSSIVGSSIGDDPLGYIVTLEVPSGDE